VVGVDGSAPSVQALRYARDEAARRGANLRVVAVVDPPVYWDVVYSGPASVEERRLTDDARGATLRLIETALADDPRPVELVVAQGSAARVLLDAAGEAELLVLGHRGRGNCEAPLGSVGLQCAQQAGCPVVIVRPRDGQPGDAPEDARAGMGRHDSAPRA
jgi:nucleotide-binding universal stress UspA family protein